MFPLIKHLDDLRPHIADRPEINITTHSNGYHVVCYSISAPNTFHDPDPVKESFLRECRGITFYPDGAIAARPLHKFFNVGENAQTQMSLDDLLELENDGNIARFMDKRDGSMLHPVLVNRQIVLKSKKSFTSDVAIKATEFLYRPENANILSFINACISRECTPIFEFTAPDNRIVLPYESQELRLLQLRWNQTGAYETDPRLYDDLAREYDLLLVDEYDLTLDLHPKLASLETTEGIEGYIIQFKNGNMVKLKTPWYLALHRSVTFTRVRDVAEMFLDEQTDDYKSYLSSVNDQATIKRVEEIETRVLQSINMMKEMIDYAIDVTPDSVKASRKDFALYHKGKQSFSLLMQKFSGQEPDYKEYYRRHFLKDTFGLEQL